jgi:uncharacterized protein YcfJ
MEGVDMRSKLIVSIVAVMIVAMLAGCATQQPMGLKQKQGVVGGAALGGILGAIIGNNIGDGNNQALGAAMGATLGGAAGSNYGRSQDQIGNRISGMERQINTEVVTVTNDNGSTTSVMLQKLPGGGYRGPRGEEYSSLPTQAQLKPVYGLRY